MKKSGILCFILLFNDITTMENLVEEDHQHQCDFAPIVIEEDENRMTFCGKNFMLIKQNQNKENFKEYKINQSGEIDNQYPQIGNLFIGSLSEEIWGFFYKDKSHMLCINQKQNEESTFYTVWEIIFEKLLFVDISFVKYVMQGTYKNKIIHKIIDKNKITFYGSKNDTSNSIQGNFDAIITPNIDSDNKIKKALTLIRELDKKLNVKTKYFDIVDIFNTKETQQVERKLNQIIKNFIGPITYKEKEYAINEQEINMMKLELALKEDDLYIEEEKFDFPFPSLEQQTKQDGKKALLPLLHEQENIFGDFEMGKSAKS